MKKPIPGFPLSADDPQGKSQNRVGSLFSTVILFVFLFSGCQGNDDPSIPSLPSNVANVSRNETNSFAPASASAGDLLYVAWTDQAGPLNHEVFLSRSTNGGADFSAPLNISQSVPFSGNSKIALFASSVYVVWEEFITDKNETDIFFRRGDDQNGTLVWDPPLTAPGRNLSDFGLRCGVRKNGPCPSQRPAVAVIGSNVFVAWDEATDYNFKVASIEPLANSFEVVNSEILMVHSPNNGITFLPFPGQTSTNDPRPQPISSVKPPGGSPSLNPTLVAGGGHLYIAWEDFAQPGTQILFRRVPDPLNGTFFPTLGTPASGSTPETPPAQALIRSGSIVGATRPTLAAEGETLLLTWEGFASPDSSCPLIGADGSPLPNSEIFLVRSNDGGVTFEPANPSLNNVSNTLCSSNNGKVTLSGSSVSVVWEDNSPGFTGISFRKSADGGITFSPTENLSQTAGSASNPALASFGVNLYAFWEDSTLGNLEIVFARR